jgi:hypothetical protein
MAEYETPPTNKEINQRIKEFMIYWIDDCFPAEDDIHEEDGYSHIFYQEAKELASKIYHSHIRAGCDHDEAMNEAKQGLLEKIIPEDLFKSSGRYRDNVLGELRDFCRRK